MSKLSTSTDVLSAIRKQKASLRKEIAVSQATIKDTAHALVSPAMKISQQGHSVSQLVSRGMAIFEGVRIGLRLIHATRKLLGRGKRK